MLNTPNGRGNRQLVRSMLINLQNPDTLLNQLKKTAIDERLLHILQLFFSEKANSNDPDDRKYLIDLATEINNVLHEFPDNDLKIMLMQRLIIFGVNHPQLVTYYYDAFVIARQNIKPKNIKKLISRLIQKTEVAELYPPAYKQFPSLKESLQTQLHAWIKKVEKEEYGFYTAGGNDLGAIVKIKVTPGIFMNVYRTMEDTGFIESAVSHKQLYHFFSQTLVSKHDKKIKAETFRNGFVYDDIKEIQKAKYHLNKMLNILEETEEMILRRRK